MQNIFTKNFGVLFTIYGDHMPTEILRLQSKNLCTCPCDRVLCASAHRRVAILTPSQESYLQRRANNLVRKSRSLKFRKGRQKCRSGNSGKVVTNIMLSLVFIHLIMDQKLKLMLPTFQLKTLSFVTSCCKFTYYSSPLGINKGFHNSLL